ISSGYLSSQETLAVLDGMRSSALYRTDQNSYLLYPNKELPKFLEKNNIESHSVKSNELLNRLLTDENYDIIQPDIQGGYHFNGNFKNASDVQLALDQLAQMGYEALVEKNKESVLQIFENVFNHKAFTGRSGTFYAYEGLGSIYWHMVSKLHLAVQESLLRAIDQNDDTLLISKLSEHYDAIGAGIGIHKSPDLYGAFPSDPYSHTPMHRGAQQPGMTGQVKEDIIVRMAELGIRVVNGKLGFDPSLLKKDEFLKEDKTGKYIDVLGQEIEISLKSDSLFFTYCQIPVVYTISDRTGISLKFYDQSPIHIDSLELDADISRQIFGRSAIIKEVTVFIQESQLRH
ncbi:MAG: hypothetical protein WBO36_07575, partial [Saprospiraceae bacterium]